ncbi:exported hypothetical protein [Candidatus Nitrospira nitrosa]|uniref:Uncharacterized protein n=1 Tax=Candidatus Nitrospira nitrosa TaxID=1742972 RepID=A0A0S4L4N4_9BACT|nr:exported hypothetical protein [Candidatus Nitrospira nitrosa]
MCPSVRTPSGALIVSIPGFVFADLAYRQGGRRAPSALPMRVQSCGRSS